MFRILAAALCAASPFAIAQNLAAELSGDPGANIQVSASLAANPDQREQALAVLPSTGLLLVPDSTNNRIMAFDPATGLLVDANFIPSSPTQLSTPIDVVLSADGSRVLVSDQIRDVVQAFDLATGAFVATFAPAGGVNNAVLDNIRGIERLANGSLLVTVGAGGNSNTVAQFSAAGATLPVLVASGAGGLDSPFDVYRIPTSSGPLNAGEFLVSSSGTAAAPGRVFRFSAAGQPLGVFATAGIFSQQIIQARNGNILVAVFSPPAEDGVFEFLPNGSLLRRLDNPELAGYRGVWELASGNILTTNGNGVHEIDRTTGALIASRITGISGRYIAFERPAEGVDLALTLNVIGSNTLGELQSLTLQAQNLGTTSASAAEVRFRVPSFLTIAGSSCALTSVADGTSWLLGTLAGATSASCQIQLRNSGIGSDRVQFQIRAAGTDPNPNNNNPSIVLGVNAPAVPALNTQMLALLLLLVAGAGLWAQMQKAGG